MAEPNGMNFMVTALLKTIGVNPEEIQKFSQEVVPMMIQAAQMVGQFDKRLKEIEAQNAEILAILRANYPKAEVIAIEDKRNAG